jgi:hypothetical protein
MREAVLLVVLFVVIYSAFALLAASQAKNWSRLMGKSHRSQRAAWSLRVVGYGLLAASLPLALVRDGATFGSLLWGCALSAAAVAVALTLTWRPVWLRVLVTPVWRLAR